MFFLFYMGFHIRVHNKFAQEQVTTGCTTPGMVIKRRELNSAACDLNCCVKNVN